MARRWLLGSSGPLWQALLSQPLYIRPECGRLEPSLPVRVHGAPKFVCAMPRVSRSFEPARSRDLPIPAFRVGEVVSLAVVTTTRPLYGGEYGGSGSCAGGITARIRTPM